MPRARGAASPQEPGQGSVWAWDHGSGGSRFPSSSVPVLHGDIRGECSLSIFSLKWMTFKVTLDVTGVPIKTQRGEKKPVRRKQGREAGREKSGGSLPHCPAARLCPMPTPTSWMWRGAGGSVGSGVIRHTNHTWGAASFGPPCTKP